MSPDGLTSLVCSAYRDSLALRTYVCFGSEIPTALRCSAMGWGGAPPFGCESHVVKSCPSLPGAAQAQTWQCLLPCNPPLTSVYTS